MQEKTTWKMELKKTCSECSKKKSAVIIRKLSDYSKNCEVMSKSYKKKQNWL